MRLFKSSPLFLAQIFLLVLIGSSTEALAQLDARLTTKVVDAKGKALAGIEVEINVSGPEGKSQTGTTNKKGRFTIARLADGVYVPALTDKSYRIGNFEFKARGGDGQIVVDQNLPVAAGESMPSFSAQTNMRGTLVLTAVPAATEASLTNDEIVTAQETSSAVKTLNAFFESGDWAGLVSAYDGLADADKEQGGPLYLYGVGLWQQKQHDQAAEALMRSKAATPDQPGIAGTIGRVLLDGAKAKSEAGQTDAAKAQYKQAAELFAEQITLTPDQSNLTFRVFALEGAGEMEATLEALDALIAVDPTDSRPKLRKAVVLVDAGQSDAAIALLRELEPSRQIAEQIYNATVEIWNNGDAEATIQAMDYAIEMAPEFEMPYRLKGMALVSAGRNDEAIKFLKIFVEKMGDDPEADGAKQMLSALGGT